MQIDKTIIQDTLHGMMAIIQLAITALDDQTELPLKKLTAEYMPEIPPEAVHAKPKTKPIKPKIRFKALSEDEKDIILSRELRLKEKEELTGLKAKTVSYYKAKLEAKEYKPYTQDELDFVSEAKSNGLSAKEISEKLGRSVRSIENILYRINKNP